MEQVILALDQATHTGWAIYKDGRITAHGVEVFSRDLKTDLLKWLGAMLQTYKVTTIVAEAYYKTKDAKGIGKRLKQIADLLAAAAEQAQIPITYIRPMRVQSRMGTSAATYKERKSNMKKAVSKLGYQLYNGYYADDEADAIAILLYYLNRNGLPVSHPKAA